MRRWWDEDYASARHALALWHWKTGRIYGFVISDGRLSFSLGPPPSVRIDVGPVDDH